MFSHSLNIAICMHTSLEQEHQRAEQAEQARRNAVPQLLQMGLSVEQVAQALSLSVEEVQAMSSDITL